MDTQQSDYLKYRGKCKSLSEQWVAEHPEYRLVRGYYFCPIWNNEDAHWWTVAQDGTIYDPSKDQFPSKGMGIYTEFDGTVECAQCGKTIQEEDARFDSRYAFCSGDCNMRFVGL